MEAQAQTPDWLHAYLTQEGFTDLSSICNWANGLYESSELTLEVLVCGNAVRLFAMDDKFLAGTPSSYKTTRYYHRIVKDAAAVDAFLSEVNNIPKVKGY